MQQLLMLGQHLEQHNRNAQYHQNDTGDPIERFGRCFVGEYRGDSDLGKLMHDFDCTDAEDMYFDLLAEKTRYLKENPRSE